jgi:hypothetical protein
MISRSTLIGALVVVELAIVGMAAKAIAGDRAGLEPSFGFTRGNGSFAASVGDSPARLDTTLAAGATPHVLLDVHDVDVIVQTSDTPVVRAVERLVKSGYVGGTIEPLTAKMTPEGVRISSARACSFRFMMGDLTHELRVTVPPGTNLEVISAGSIDATGLRSKIIAHVPTGVVRISNHRGDVDVSTGEGRIYLRNVESSDIAATTRQGRLYFTRVSADRIDAHTDFGRIYAVDIRAVDGALTTKSGRIEASFAGNSDAVVNASNRGDGRTRVSGIPSTDEGTNGRTVRFGSGRGRFEVSSDDGPVVITQGATV